MKDKLDFWWEVHRLLEARINMLDSKAGVIIAIETGLFALIAFIVDKNPFKEQIYWAAYVLLVLTAISAGAIILALLWTIRPTDCLMGKKITLEDINQHHLIWPDKEPQRVEFEKKAATLEDKIAEEDLTDSVFKRHQLLRRKYSRYTFAIWLAKIQMCITFLILAVMSIWLLYYKF